uniref:Pyrroline-5-carboxylate reductase n=1 Tax=Bionectria ochroleuca TaxID=29856 RepID=A0A0B7KM39_BIOOC
MAPALQESKLAFIGGGNMAGAIIGGLIAKGVNKHNIYVSEPWEVNRDKLAATGVRTTTSNVEAAQDADIVIIAVKPQVTKTVSEELGAAWSSRTTLPIIDITAEEKELVSALLASVSKATEWVDKEELLDVVTGLSGSGPAYFFNMVEHLISSAVALGLPRDQATRLASQTCFGAGKMLVESSDDPAQLRKNVTSPNGTTHAALETFKAEGFEQIVDKSVKAATHRADELGQTLGKQ